MNARCRQRLEHAMEAIIARGRFASRLVVSPPKYRYLACGHVLFTKVLRRWTKDLDRRSGAEQSGADRKEQAIQLRHEQACARA